MRVDLSLVCAGMCLSLVAGCTLIAKSQFEDNAGGGNGAAAAGGTNSSDGGSSLGGGGDGGQGEVGGGGAGTGAGGSGGAGGAPGGPPCTPIALVDPFDGTAVNQSIWNLQGQTNMFVVGNGSIRLDGGQPGVAGGWSGLVTPQRFDFDEDCVWVEVLDLHHNGIQGGTYWQLYSDMGTASFNVSGGMLDLHIATGGTPVDAAMPYNATDHRWWRIREAGGTLYMETAPLGKVWTERLSAPSPAYLNDVTVGLGVTGADTQPIVGYTELDNLNVPAP